jgi:hypothetical protein
MKEKVDSLASPRHKQPSQPYAKANVLEAKQKRRKLWHTLDMQPVSTRAEPAIDNEVVDADLVDEVEGGGVGL